MSPAPPACELEPVAPKLAAGGPVSHPEPGCSPPVWPCSRRFGSWAGAPSPGWPGDGPERPADDGGERPAGVYGVAGGMAGGCGAAALGPPGQASSAIESQDFSCGSGGRAGTDRIPPAGRTVDWTHGSSLSGLSAGSQGGFPDTLGTRVPPARDDPRPSPAVEPPEISGRGPREVSPPERPDSPGDMFSGSTEEAPPHVGRAAPADGVPGGAGMNPVPPAAADAASFERRPCTRAAARTSASRAARARRRRSCRKSRMNISKTRKTATETATSAASVLRRLPLREYTFGGDGGPAPAAEPAGVDGTTSVN